MSKYHLRIELVKDGQGVQRDDIEFPEGVTELDMLHTFDHTLGGVRGMMDIVRIIVGGRNERERRTEERSQGNGN